MGSRAQKPSFFALRISGGGRFSERKVKQGKECCPGSPEGCRTDLEEEDSNLRREKVLDKVANSDQRREERCQRAKSKFDSRWGSSTSTGERKSGKHLGVPGTSFREKGSMQVCRQGMERVLPTRKRPKGVLARL